MPVVLPSRWKQLFLAAIKAVVNGSIDDVRLFVEQGVSVYAKDGFGKTLLFHAVENHSDINVMKYLVENGADVNASTRDGWTPLFEASYDSSIEIVKFLVDCGADPNKKTREGMTPLHHAGSNTNIDVMKYLIEKGADINAINGFGWTPLDDVHYKEQVAILREAGGKTGDEIFEIIEKIRMRPKKKMRFHRRNPNSFFRDISNF